MRIAECSTSHSLRLCNTTNRFVHWNSNNFSAQHYNNNFQLETFATLTISSSSLADFVTFKGMDDWTDDDFSITWYDLLPSSDAAAWVFFILPSSQCSVSSSEAFATSWYRAAIDNLHVISDESSICVHMDDNFWSEIDYKANLQKEYYVQAGSTYLYSYAR